MRNRFVPSATTERSTCHFLEYCFLMITRNQNYYSVLQKSSDSPTWSAIKEIKETALMPVIGNGNVSSIQEAQRMMAETGCDAVMVARAAIRNPWIFSQFALSNNKNHPDDQAVAVRDDEAMQSLNSDPSSSSSSSLSLPSGPLEEYWPTMDQLIAAESEYFKSVEESNSKLKFINFHRKNFERLKSAVRTGNRNAPVGSPRTIHL